MAIALPAAAAAEAGRRLGITLLLRAACSTRRCATSARSARELRIRTVFNFLGPLANPARPAAQVLGVPDERIGDLMAGVLAGAGHEGAGRPWRRRPGRADGARPVDGVGPHHGRAAADHRRPGRARLPDAPHGVAARRHCRRATPRSSVRCWTPPSDSAVAGVRDAVSLNAAAALVAYAAAGGSARRRDPGCVSLPARPSCRRAACGERRPRLRGCRGAAGPLDQRQPGPGLTEGGRKPRGWRPTGCAHVTRWAAGRRRRRQNWVSGPE